MLKVLKVATVLSVACVTAASAAPGVNGLQGDKTASRTAIELVRSGNCSSHGCSTSRWKGRRHAKAAHRERRRSHASHRGSRRQGTRLSQAASGVSRSCLTSPARALLSRIESRFGRVNLISTCRPGARIAGSGRISRHASGNAVDFDAGGRKSQIVSWLIANHKSGGTMTYPSMNHVHVDIGPHFVSIAGGRRYASWSSRNKASHRSGRVARASTYRKHAVKRGPSIARADVDSDSDD